MVSRLKVMVLAGGPDRERAVSLDSGAQVAVALREAGHEVMERDILPGDLSALEEFGGWDGEVIFPVMHGSWGEGGGLQRILEERGLRYVGCRAEAAGLCMDKARTKRALMARGLPTPGFEVVEAGGRCSISPPVVIKPPCEGSSIDVVMCKTTEEVEETLGRLRKEHRSLMAEQFVTGKELTVGVIGFDPGGGEGGKGVVTALPAIQIVPASGFYDYQAKYVRNDTRYLFDIDLPAAVLEGLGRLAVEVFGVLGCRHMSRVDAIVDGENRPWVLEVNTIPGFTSHSLLPKAAARSGIPLAALVDRLARLGAGE